MIWPFAESSLAAAPTPAIPASINTGRGVYISVTATPSKLTADGSSTARIRAEVTDIRHQPVSGERVVFSMSSDNGNLVTLDRATDSRGVAEAVYTAGTEMGSVVITALDTSAGISGSTTIVLMSDAPANVALNAANTTLPADGRSRTDISIDVSDINNNPNQGAVIEYEIVRGGGTLDVDVNETNRNGAAENGYRAGHAAGTVSIKATVTSRIPSEEEMNKAKGSVFAGQLYDGFEEGEVVSWYKEAGDEVERGEPIVRVSTDMGEFDILARHAGRFDSVKKYEDDDFVEGDTLGIIEID